MTRLTNWSAKRSGAAISITGENEDGHEQTFSGLKLITRAQIGVVALDEDGNAILHLD